MNEINSWHLRRRAPGHTILVATQQERGGHYCVTLECSCSLVFATKNCLPSEREIAKGLVLEEGRAGANEHVARVEEALQTLGVKRACAA